MTTMARRTPNPIAELLGWLEGEHSTFGLAPSIRMEDFIDGGEYVLRTELPGIDPDKDVEVSVDGDVLTIQGERTEQMKTKNRQEFHYGSFSRAVTLPAGARTEDIKATYTDGVLELRMPLTNVESPPRKIPVQRAES